MFCRSSAPPAFRTVFRNQAVSVVFGDFHFLRSALVALHELRPALLFQIHAHGVGDHLVRTAVLRLRRDPDLSE
jgi:hypothetical protein